MSHISKGQEMLLVSFQKIIDGLPDGVHRVVVIPRIDPPLACHIGKKNGTFVASGATWANFTLIVGEILDRELEIQVVVQSFIAENPDSFGDLEDSTSPQNIIGWAVNQEGGMLELRRKDLLEIFPYRNGVDATYQGR